MKAFYPLIIASLLAGSGFSSSAGANELLVPSQYPTIQAAIDAAVNGDTVVVSPGTYLENIDFLGKAITVSSSDGPEATLIDASLASSKVSVAAFQNGEGPDSVLQGFTLTKGKGTYVELPNPHDYSDFVGGGIFCNQASPTIRNNICFDNVSVYGGGIGCVHSAAPQIEGNTVVDNRATFGSGIACIDLAVPMLIGNRVMENHGAHTGGGFYLWSSSPVVIDNLIEGNGAQFGGGIACIIASPLIANNLFHMNLGGYGGGIYGGFESMAQIVNNTFYDNTAPYGSALCSWRSSLSMDNCVVWSPETRDGPAILIGTTSNPSTFHISHCNIKGGMAAVEVEPGCAFFWGEGMVNADPLFVDAPSGDFHLIFNSPCRGSGDNAVAGVLDHDFEGDPRTAYGTVDIGADEFHTHLYYTGDVTPGGSIEGKLTGLPGTSPVALLFGVGVLEQPLSTPWGEFFLQPPWIVVLLGSLPSTGVLVLSDTLPVSPAAPYDVPMQALIGTELTNLSVIEVR
ncbi:MAG: right-handed parallel beta-helix repeat-containing protein [Planctomycetota bacterium]